MTISAFDIYLLGLVGSLKVVLFIIASSAAAFSGVHFASWGDSRRSVLAGARAKAKEDYRLAKRALVVASVTATLGIVTPDQKTLAGMYVLPAVVNSDFVQELPAEVTALARTYVKDLLAEYADEEEEK